MDESTLADKGYIRWGGVLTPAQRKAGVRVRAAVKEDNCRINRLRSVVEWVIAHIKTWWVLHMGFQRPLGFLCEGFFFWYGRWCVLRIRTPYE